MAGVPPAKRLATDPESPLHHHQEPEQQREQYAHAHQPDSEHPRVERAGATCARNSSSHAPQQQGPAQPLPTQPAKPLPKDLFLHALSFLPDNEIAFNGRLACKDAAAYFAASRHCTVTLSQPLPENAVQAYFSHVAPLLPPLSIEHKLLLLSSAAKSGCQTNCDAAWQLLTSTLFTEFTDKLSTWHDFEFGADPATIAVQHGHVHLLPYILQQRWPVHSSRVLLAAAARCTLEQLLQVWNSVPWMPDMQLPKADELLHAALESPHPDWRAKAEWALQEPRLERATLNSHAVAAAARSGDAARLAWLEERGCRLQGSTILAAALQHASLDAVERLVDKGGWSLAPSHDAAAGSDSGGSDDDGDDGDSRDGGACTLPLTCAAAASGSVAKLRWLRDRGVQLTGGELPYAVAAPGGGMEAVRYLYDECGQTPPQEAMTAAFRAGNVAAVRWLLRHGCAAPTSAGRYLQAGRLGGSEMVRWLVQEARSPWEEKTLPTMIRRWPVTCDGCLAAVEVMVGARCPVEGKASLEAAAERGDLPLVRFLVQRAGCSVHNVDPKHWVAGGCVALLEWVRDQGYDWVGKYKLVWDTGRAYGRAHDKASMMCLRRMGVAWHERALRGALGERLALLKWMAEQGAAAELPAVWEALKRVDKGRLEGSEKHTWLLELRDKLLKGNAGG